jgi:glycosyltransferase involved in cell wall biosynthesis
VLVHVVTIAARNYLGRARVLADSLATWCPDDQMTVLLVDALPGEFASEEHLRIVTPADLPLEADELRRMAMIYDITELATALKPWALQLLLDEGAEVATYLDPDIVVYGSLREVEKLGLEHGIVLTPHRDEPMPRDGLRPNEADIMSAGVFNLGFIAVGSQARDLLGWWQERLLRDSLVAPEQMLFVDQRWIDLVPGFFSHAVLRDPGYNVAYWNLDTRVLQRDGDELTVNGAPLRFFHFSGYQPERPWILSHYVRENPRVVLSEQPVVRELCDGYTRLVTAQGDMGVQYRFGWLDDAVPVTPSTRGVYRDALLAAEKDGSAPPPLVFGPEGDGELIAWLREPVRPRGRVNRFLQAYWSARPDLRAAFPDPLGADEDALLGWAWETVGHDGGLVPELLPAPPEPVVVEVIPTTEPGLTLAGYFTAELGVGEMGRLLVAGARESGLPFSTLTTRQTLSRQQAHFRESSTATLHPVVVAAVNADRFPVWSREVGAEVLDGRYVIGMWAWELEDFLPHPTAFALVDEVWTLSEFARTAIQRHTQKPVRVIPLPRPEPAAALPLDRAALGLSDGPYVLFAFDYLSVFERKNPLAAVEAFTRAFDDGAGPTLVLKSINGDKRRSDRERLRRACEWRTDVLLIEDYLDSDVVSSLMGEAAAYLSLHRSEGYGLTLAEAMSRGVPVIATGYSGNLDFMTAETCLLVPYTRVAVASGCEPYPTTLSWAEPDVGVASTYLRWVHDRPEEAAALGERGREHLRSAATPERTADFLRARVADVMARRSDDLPPPPAVVIAEPSAQSAVEAALALVRTAPDLVTPTRAPRLAGLYRRVLYRLLAHHDEQLALRLEGLAAATVRVEWETRHRDAMARLRLEEADAQHGGVAESHADALHRLELAVRGLQHQVNAFEVPRA